MSQIYVIGDTHFGHRLAAEKRGFASVEEHDLELVRRWNSVIGKKDTVIVLGDVAFGDAGLARLEKCRGLKKLVMGNHDQYPSHNYLYYFARLMGSMPVSGGLMTHIPIHPQELGRWRFNIHGHLHAKTVGDPRYVCVSAEQTNLTPILLAGIIESMNRLFPKPTIASQEIS